jgi:uncharacterized protein involved in response to NO
MPSLAADPSLPTGYVAVLAAAPHRLLFWMGASNVLLARSTWALRLIATRWRRIPVPVSPVSRGMHAAVEETAAAGTALPRGSS